VSSGTQEARPVYRELRCLELKEGQQAMRFFLTISPEVEFDQPTRLMVGNQEVTVVVPNTFSRGEKIIVLAPAH
jgi:hypothetical protein